MKFTEIVDIRRVYDHANFHWFPLYGLRTKAEKSEKMTIYAAYTRPLPDA